MKEKALHDCTTEELKSELERREREEEEKIKVQEDIVNLRYRLRKKWKN